MLELAFPWALALLPLPALVLWLAPARREVVQAVRIPFFEGASAGLVKGEGADVLPRTRLQMGFAWLLWALVLLTFARPEWVGAPIERAEPARDVMLAVDISGSMQTRDFIGADGARGSRLDGVRSVLDGFIADRRDDRIGLVVFGSAPYVLVPFTRDTAAARSDRGGTSMIRARAGAGWATGQRRPKSRRPGHRRHPVKVTLTLLVPTFMPEPPVWPDLEIADAITRLPERATRPVTRRIGQASWSGVARTWESRPSAPPTTTSGR